MSTGVTTLDGDDLDGFIRGLAADWRGWDGDRAWISLEEHMSIVATHDDIGHVRLRVTLRRSLDLDAWSGAATPR
jgi:hypothetical protein